MSTSLIEWQASCPIIEDRERLGMTLTGFAHEMGVSVNTARAWQHGSKPRPDHLAAMGRLFKRGFLKRLDIWHGMRPQR